jgi:hypothetical protein
LMTEPSISDDEPLPIPLDLEAKPAEPH